MRASELANPTDLAAAVVRGDRTSIAIALNLLDDKRENSRLLAAEFLSELQRTNQNTHSHLIGITGPPGVGKSSLTASLITHWRKQRLSVGVLAVDPSSPISGGALLGDRLRMKTSSEDEGVFVRSLACRGEFGGLSAEVWPMSVVMMAAFDITLIETVGVGQREIDVSQLCDTTCYVAQPGSGDSVQFLKAGILEVPHILVVNKQDMGEVARRTLSELGSALSKEHPDGQWQVPVLSVSATLNSGIETLAAKMQEHHAHLLATNSLEQRRISYRASWVGKRLRSEFGSHGIERLGGEQTLFNLLQESQLGPLENYQSLRQQLLANTTPTH